MALESFDLVCYHATSVFTVIATLQGRQSDSASVKFTSPVMGDDAKKWLEERKCSEVSVVELVNLLHNFVTLFCRATLKSLKRMDT